MGLRSSVQECNEDKEARATWTQGGYKDATTIETQALINVLVLAREMEVEAMHVHSDCKSKVMKISDHMWMKHRCEEESNDANDRGCLETLIKEVVTILMDFQVNTIQHVTREKK